ncbi:MAG: hypothetical protein ACLR23_28480 [Clostridia bacterium]
MKKVRARIYVEDADGVGENHRPAGIVETKFLISKKLGIMPPLKRVVKTINREMKLRPSQKRLRESVGGHAGEDDIDDGADNGVVQGIAVGDPDGGVGENLFVGFQIKAFGKEPDLLDGARCPDRLGADMLRNVYIRIEGDNKDKDHNENGDTIDNPAS